MTLAVLLMGINAPVCQHQHDLSDLALDKVSQDILQQQMASITLCIEGDPIGVSYLRQQLKQYADSLQPPPFLVENTANPDYRLVVGQRHYALYSHPSRISTIVLLLIVVLFVVC